jgi:putative phosphoesterase
MKLLIASDIHGSAKYCRELIGAFTREGADRLLLLGDVLYHGPRNALPEGYAPMETAAQLNAMRGRVFSVRGNCDADIDSVVLSFPTSADHAYLPAGNRLIFATHGHIYDKQNPPPLSSGDVLLCGHTHVPACEDMGGFIYMNPGSVSIPKEGSERGYMLFDGARFIWKTLDGREIMEYSLE